MTDPRPEPDPPPVEEILAELRTLVASMPTEEDANRALHVEQQVSRMLRMFIIPVVASSLFIPFALWQAWAGHEATQRNRTFQACMLAQQAEERVTHHLEHQAFAEKFQVNLPNNSLLPVRPSHAQLLRLCDRFYRSEVAP